MLQSLSIRNVVLIEKLDIEFNSGLCVLTGETGAGKSILLDSLGLALGGRSDVALLRAGSETATVSAAFSCPSPGVRGLLLKQGFAEESLQEELILKRVLGQDGRSRAFINGEPISVGVLKQIGQLLADVHGQFENQRLLDGSRHLDIVDAYLDLGKERTMVSAAWREWRALVEAVSEARQAYEKACQEEDFLRHAIEEMNSISPEPGEEVALADKRTLMMNSEKIIDGLDQALKELTTGRGAEGALQGAVKHLNRLAEKVDGRFEEVISTLDRAAVELSEALAELNRLRADLDLDPADLERTEERLFALRALARKHGVEVEGLADLLNTFTHQLEQIQFGEKRIEELRTAEQNARDTYIGRAKNLSLGRAKGGVSLSKAINDELSPLRLATAAFSIDVNQQNEEHWSASGMDSVTFQVSTNPGSKPGPIGKVASGGELARFMLALKVVLAKADPVPTIVFDEVDSGIGGATAAAVGERLSALSGETQVLVVTHSPQVAARGQHHWRVSKLEGDISVQTSVKKLNDGERREEVARMLSGTEITDEARAQAARLLSSKERGDAA